MTGVLAVPGRVLIHHPQSGVEQRIHTLLDAGHHVTVATTTPTPTIDDLANRGLIEIVDHVDPLTFDVAIRDRVNPTPTTDHAHRGMVTLVGGGPGPTGLLTLEGLSAIRSADVVLCDRLAPLGVLDEAPGHAEVIHVGKIPRGHATAQSEINELLVKHAQAGRHVVRFKGGDSFVFGRGGEEWNACREAGVPVRVIPGVTSAVAAAALAGIPVTHRDVTQGFVVVSGHAGPGDERDRVNWRALVEAGLTIVVMMGVASLGRITQRLIAEGMDPDTAVACVADAGMASQRHVVATVATIGDRAAAADISAPAVTIIGSVVTALQP